MVSTATSTALGSFIGQNKERERERERKIYIKQKEGNPRDREIVR